MAWNPNPKVAAARDIGTRFGKEQVIVLMLDMKSNTLEMATYGKTRELCAMAKRLGDKAYEAVMRNYAVAELEAAGPDDGCPCGSGTLLGTCPRCGREIGRVL